MKVSVYFYLQNCYRVSKDLYRPFSETDMFTARLISDTELAEDHLDSKGQATINKLRRWILGFRGFVRENTDCLISNGNKSSMKKETTKKSSLLFSLHGQHNGLVSLPGTRSFLKVQCVNVRRLKKKKSKSSPTNPTSNLDSLVHIYIGYNCKKRLFPKIRFTS